MNKKLEKNGLSQDNDLNQIIQLMKQENLDEIEISEGESHIKLVREHRVTFVPRAMGNLPMGNQETLVETKPAVEEGNPVPAPIAGVFYRSPSPASPSFVKEGDSVVQGQTLCIIEAMKVMNEVKAGVKGIVAEVCLENGHPVEFGTKLFRIV